VQKQRAGINMRIGNLSRAPIRSRGIFAFQLMRVFIVTAVAATGAFALSLSMDDPGAAPESVPESVAASERPPESAGAAQAVAQPDQAAPVQVADADPLASTAPMDGSGTPSAAPEPPVQESASVPAPADTSTDQVAAPSAGPGGDAPVPEAQQAAAEAPPPPAAEDMTGAVTVASVPAASDPADERVDLNTASFEQLNTLPNAGPIGRAIIKGRPYASVEDLVKRKVLRRSVYEKIKDQVTVR
jgi:hypothetical protein